MAWTEPGNDNRNKDQGPPDLDKILQQFSQKLKSLFGKKSAVPIHPSKGGVSVGIGIIVLVLIIIWALAGIFIVSPAEESVILQFGRYKATVGPGPHWIPRLFQSNITLNVEKISTYSYDAQMLTKDQNIVDVAVAVQYRIGNAQNYLFNVSDPTQSLQQATASALRQAIGNTNLDDVLTTGRAVVRDDVVQQLNQIIAAYKTGLFVTDVALQPAKAPEQVKDAFDDAIKAQEDQQRYQNQAQAYAMGVVPIAQGNAKRIMQEADAYRQQVVLNAQADVSRYLAMLTIYRNAPQVTRERIYLNTMQSMLQNSSKVLVDTKQNNTLYLPFDKWAAANNSALTAVNSQAAQDAADKSLAATGNMTGMNNTTNSTNMTTMNNASITPSSNNAGSDRPQRFIFNNPDSNVGQGGNQ